MQSLTGWSRANTRNRGMCSLAILTLILACLCLNFTVAFPFHDPSRFLRQREPVASKRGPQNMVDTWALCPPDMEQMDCFYTYLRLYARLRKASRNVDEVSLRNIGKRSQTPKAYMCDQDTDQLICLYHILNHNIRNRRA